MFCGLYALIFPLFKSSYELRHDKTNKELCAPSKDSLSYAHIIAKVSSLRSTISFIRFRQLGPGVFWVSIRYILHIGEPVAWETVADIQNLSFTNRDWSNLKADYFIKAYIYDGTNLRPIYIMHHECNPAFHSFHSDKICIFRKNVMSSGNAMNEEHFNSHAHQRHLVRAVSF